MHDLVERIAQTNETDLHIGTSCFEKHGTGLFCKEPVRRTCQGEVVHLHPTDGSMHLTLHPNDAKTVVEAGWGEMHPLAGVFGPHRRWFMKWMSPHMPVGFTLLYAPQSEEDIRVVEKIIRAAALHVNGREIRAVRC